MVACSCPCPCCAASSWSRLSSRAWCCWFSGPARVVSPLRTAAPSGPGRREVRWLAPRSWAGPARDLPRERRGPGLVPGVARQHREQQLLRQRAGQEAIFARLGILARHAARTRREALDSGGLKHWQFKVLLMLRRLGPPYAAFERHSRTEGHGEGELLAALSPTERRTLARLLRKLVVAVEQHTSA